VNGLMVRAHIVKTVKRSTSKVNDRLEKHEDRAATESRYIKHTFPKWRGEMETERSLIECVMLITFSCMTRQPRLPIDCTKL
jgi:hypothetical protein